MPHAWARHGGGGVEAESEYDQHSYGGAIPSCSAGGATTSAAPAMTITAVNAPTPTAPAGKYKAPAN